MFIVPLINLSYYREGSAKNSEGYGENYFHTPILQKIRDFPGGPVVKNLPSNAGDMGSIPGWKIMSPRDAGQLRWCATNTDPVLSGARLPQLPRSLRAAMKDPACCS